MSNNQPSSNNDFDMIAISTIAAQWALDIRGPFPQQRIDLLVPRVRFLGTRQRPTNIDQEFMTIWNDSQTKKDYDDFDPAMTTEASEGLKTVYRVCLRVFGTSPHEILSMKHKLRYRPTPPPGMGASRVVYTPKFSQLFAELAVHPCWEGNPKILVMAIEYTVKVRVDDRTLWPMIDALPEHIQNCPVLEALLEMFQVDEDEDEILGTTSIQAMLIQAWNAQTEGSASEFSEFLVFLGQIARMYPSSDYSQTYLGLRTLPVTTTDLQILIKAVKHFYWDNVDWTECPEEVFRAFKRKGGVSDDKWPRNNREMKWLTRRALMCSYHSVATSRHVSPISDPPEETASDNEVLPGDESGFESD